MVSRSMQYGMTSLKQLAVLAVLAGGVSSFAEDSIPAKPTLDGITLPFDGPNPRELKFEAQGTIKSVTVKPGDHVKAGQVLAAQDDRKEQAELTGLKEDATDIDIKSAQIEARLKHTEVDRLTKLHAEAQNDSELDKAKAEADYADAQIISKQAEQKVKQSKVLRQEVVIDMMQLKSPVDGYVLEVDTHAGEIADPQKPVLKIVANDPLQVSVQAPTSVSQKLKLGQKLRVSYDGKDWTEAAVSYLAPQADGVGIQKVWLQLANPEHRDSGLKVIVELTDDLAKALAQADETAAIGK